MSKLLLVIIAALLVYWVLSAYHKTLKPRRGADNKIEDMVRCAYCGVNLPKSESLNNRGEFFCSHEHSRLFPEKNKPAR